MISIRRYSPAFAEAWNEVLNDSFNGTFLHSRSFLAYHGSRFEDFSVLGFKGDIPIVIFPANIWDNTIYSHQGLSYAGFIIRRGTSIEDIKSVIDQTLSFYRNSLIKNLVIKMVPDIYSAISQKPVVDILIELGAELIRRDFIHALSLPIEINAIPKRLRSLKHDPNIKIEKNSSFQSFWEKVLIPNLSKKHGVKPLHTAEEINYLASAHPGNILQYNVMYKEELVGGTTIFNTSLVAHSQYIASTEPGRKIKALDHLFKFLFFKEFPDKKYFSFGVSHDPKSLLLNIGLAFWKESLGARQFNADFYRINFNTI